MPENTSRTSDEIRTGYIEGNGFKRREVRYSLINGRAIFEGDIELDIVDAAGATRGLIVTWPRLPAPVIPSVGSPLDVRLRWPGGVVPFTIDAALPNTVRVTRAIEHWHAMTDIRLIARTDEENFVTFVDGVGCSSKVGMRGGQQRIVLGPGCGRTTVIHEIGHAVGLWHEQSREDRDDFVRILKDNIEPGKEHNFDQNIVDGDDVGEYDFVSTMHYSAFDFSRNGQPTIEARNGASIAPGDDLSDGDIGAVRRMYFPPVALPLVLPAGAYTIQQRSTQRYVDAHADAEHDFGIVSRPQQGNASQRWRIIPLAGVYTIRQQSTGRFMDAHQRDDRDYALVTRPRQDNASQRWMVRPADDGSFTIQQLSSKRFVDAHDSAADDHHAVTRGAQSDDTQRWAIAPSQGGSYSIRQISSGRYLDAHAIAGKDFGIVTRESRGDSSQHWMLDPVGVVCAVQQGNTARFWDAHDTGANDFRLVTRRAQRDGTQTWLMNALGDAAYSIQQLDSGRFVDAHQIEARDFALVTRNTQDNDSQQWRIRPV